MIITFVGSGGKTSAIFYLAQGFHRQGKKVFITTTTQMYQPEMFQKTGRTLPFYEARFCTLSGSLSEIEAHLDKDGICIAGLPSSKNPTEKFSALPASIYQSACLLADVVLVEGDGSKHMLLKYPAAHEPVIPKNAEQIYVLYNSIAIGQPLFRVTFRLEGALHCLNQSGQFPAPCTPDTLVSQEIIDVLYESGYLRPIRKQFPEVPLALLDGTAFTAASPNPRNNLYHKFFG